MIKPGPIISAKEIRAALQAQLELWLPAYIAELKRRNEGFTLPDVKSWKRLPDFKSMTADQSPTVVVTSPGIRGVPVRDEEGRYSAVWELHAYVFVRGSSYEETADRVGFYTAAIRTAVVHAGLGLEEAKIPRPIGEGYNELDSSKARTVGAGVVVFEVAIGDILDENAAPLLVPAAPDYVFAQDPVGETTHIDVQQL